MALGGNCGRLFRQLLTESLPLVTAGGAMGWLFPLAAARVLALGWCLEFDLRSGPERQDYKSNRDGVRQNSLNCSSRGKASLPARWAASTGAPRSVDFG
jgi:hypothetical protein